MCNENVFIKLDLLQKLDLIKLIAKLKKIYILKLFILISNRLLVKMKWSNHDFSILSFLFLLR